MRSDENLSHFLRLSSVRQVLKLLFFCSVSRSTHQTDFSLSLTVNVQSLILEERLYTLDCESDSWKWGSGEGLWLWIKAWSFVPITPFTTRSGVPPALQVHSQSSHFNHCAWTHRETSAPPELCLAYVFSARLCCKTFWTLGRVMVGAGLVYLEH